MDKARLLIFSYTDSTTIIESIEGFSFREDTRAFVYVCALLAPDSRIQPAASSRLHARYF